MNLQSLEYLIQVSRDMNITKSAEKLHMTQQCLSGHVKRLEDYYGVKIFERKPQLKLTEEGRAVIDFAEKTLQLEKQLFDNLYMVSTNQKGRIILGMTPARSEFLAPTILEEYARTHPHVILEIRETSVLDVSQMLLDDEMDCYIGIHDGVAPNLAAHRLRKEPIYVVISNELLYAHGNALAEDLNRQVAEHGGITLHALRDLPFLVHAEGKRMHVIESAGFVEAGFEPTIRMVSKLSATLLKMCYQGQGVCMVNSLNFESVPTDQSISTFPLLLDGKQAFHNIYMIYRKKNDYPAYYRDFVQMVLEFF